MKTYDVIIIGGGILGAMTARELSRYKLNVLVLDRAYDVGEGATKANSGVLYPGFHHRENSLKGISCVQGSKMYDAICAELKIPMKRTGCLYVAFGPEGEKTMMKKFERGIVNGTPDLSVITGDEARALEPGLSPAVTKALYTPFAGIISPFQLILNVSLSAASNGVEFIFDTEVSGIKADTGGALVKTADGRTFHTQFLVNTAGENAAQMENFIKLQDLVIRPRRGQFYIFDKQTVGKPLLSHVIYQAQEKDEGGTLIAPTVEGNVIAGPTSEDVLDYSVTDTTADGLAHVERVAKKILPGLDMGMAITNFAGVRANITNVEKEQKDFVVRSCGNFMVSALGIKNPGMTAAPYLAKLIVEKLQSLELRLIPDENFRAELEVQKPFLQESPEMQSKLFSMDSRYAKVVCRCEKITEGDIIHALSLPLPPRSLNGFKKRLRTGMGRCQGGFCTARIIDIFCRETGCEPQDFMKNTDHSPVVKGWVK